MARVGDGRHFLLSTLNVYFSDMSQYLLLLHGAIGSSKQLKPLAEVLKQQYFNPDLFDFVGHGGVQMPNADFSIDLFARDVIAWMDDYRIGCADIFGYSMGGYVALYMAKNFPGRVGKIMTVATKLEWTPGGAEREVKMLNPGKIEEKVPAFAAALRERHAPHDWKENLERTAAMMLNMGNNPPLKDDDFRSIEHRVHMCVGDKDTMVTISETEHVHRLLKNSDLKILGNTPHPVEQMDVALLSAEATDFFKLT